MERKKRLGLGYKGERVEGRKRRGWGGGVRGERTIGKGENIGKGNG